jgi:hypothetical protein
MIAWVAAALAAIALVLVGQWRMLPTADVSWQLYAAGRVLDGARIGRDVIDVNFPLIILDKLPAVLAARVLGADAWHVWLAGIVLLVGVALLVAARVPGSRFASPAYAALAALLLLAAPGGDFGQREHVVVLSVLPWLAVVGARLAGREVSRRLALVAGMLALPGLALKPFFVLVPVAVAVLQCRRGRSLGEVLTLPEQAMVLAGLPLAWLAQLAAAPEWLASARWYWPLYSRYGGGSAVQLGVLSTGVVSLVAAMAVLWYLRVRELVDAEGEALAAGALGFFACLVLQARSLSYHFVPVVALLALVALRWLAPRPQGVVPALVATAVLGVVLAGPVSDGVRAATGGPVARAQQDPNLAALQRALGSGPPGRRIAVLSTNPASIFPLVPSLAAESPLRQISLWPLIPLNAPAAFGDTVVTCTAPAAWDARERHWRDEVADDFARRGADALVVLQPDPTVRGWGDARRIDYLVCLRQDPRLVPLLDGFSDTVRVGPYRVLRRAPDRAG